MDKIRCFRLKNDDLIKLNGSIYLDIDNIEKYNPTAFDEGNHSLQITYLEIYKSKCGKMFEYGKECSDYEKNKGIDYLTEIFQYSCYSNEQIFRNRKKITEIIIKNKDKIKDILNEF
jgi:hypothetical protein